jgi:hypothetical protein
MFRRYCLAIVGALLIMGVAAAVVDAWTVLPFDPFTSTFLGRAVFEKLIGALLMLAASVLIRFMALGEEMGLIQPIESDLISLFDRDPSREPSAARRDPYKNR